LSLDLVQVALEANSFWVADLLFLTGRADDHSPPKVASQQRASGTTKRVSAVARGRWWATRDSSATNVLLAFLFSRARIIMI